MFDFAVSICLDFLVMFDLMDSARYFDWSGYLRRDTCYVITDNEYNQTLWILQLKATAKYIY